MGTKYDFGGYATRYNIRCTDERTIRDKAFIDDDGITVPLVWNHCHNDPTNVLGHVLLKHHDDGVYAYSVFNDTPKAQHAKKMVQNGDIRALSIYANQLKQNGKDVVHGHICEVSLVLKGANSGAFIDTVIAHSDDHDEEAVIYHPDDYFDFNIELDDKIEHSDEQKKEANMPEENKKEQKTEENGKTVEQVVNDMTDEQQMVVNYLVEEAYKKGAEEGKEGAGAPKEDNVKHNAFEDGATTNEGNGNETLTHAEFSDILTEAKKSGSLKDSFLAHGITNIENMFPEYRAVPATPGIIKEDDTWVNAVINGVGISPFQKVKSLDFDITKEEARARGWVRDSRDPKAESTILALRRETDGQMVYVKQSMTRDDVIDIQDFDSVALIKNVMSVKLREELARAILVGDGRDPVDADKIKEDRIRPIASDNDTYTVKYTIGTEATTPSEVAEQLPDQAVLAMTDYKGSGNLTAFVRRDIVSRMLLLKDLNKRRIYKDLNELATAMMVNKIVSVPANVMGDHYAIFVDLKDYNIGRNSLGGATFFDDFDIDFNKMKYLLEQKCSGANIKYHSALLFTKGATQEVTEP